MAYIAIVAIAAILALLAGKAVGFIFSSASTNSTNNPNKMREKLGGVSMSLAGILAMRGLAPAALGLFVFGLGLIGLSKYTPGTNRSQKPGASGKKSTIATSWLTMELNHDDATMDGEVRQGKFSGKRLSELDINTLIALLGECGDHDGGKNRSLLEAYLDRYHENWRDDKPATNATNAMSIAEALAILGLEEGASDDEIRNAHHRLMKQNHPDHGGSSYIATKINQARETLLGT